MEMIHGLKHKLYIRKKVKTRLESQKKAISHTVGKWHNFATKTL